MHYEMLSIQQNLIGSFTEELDSLKTWSVTNLRTRVKINTAQYWSQFINNVIKENVAQYTAA